MCLGNAQKYEPDTDNPDGTEDVSSSMSGASEGFEFGAVEGDGMPVPPMLPQSPEPVAAAPQARKTRVRKKMAHTVFTSEQLHVLNNCFQVRKYLSPEEMKFIAGVTGLTKKQVKTWFQNNRTKLMRRQKDSSWRLQRYMHVFQTTQTPHSQFQVNAPIFTQEQTSQFQVPVFSPFFHLDHSRAPPPSLGSTRPQGSWHVPPAVQHGEFLNYSGYVPVGGNASNGNVMIFDPDSRPAQRHALDILSGCSWMP